MQKVIRKSRQAGFTLVEIAIVLVIVGLLLAGVLKGQELIEQSRIKKVIKDFDAMTAAVETYKDRYRFYPGDDSGAALRWISGQTPFTPAAAADNGNANGSIYGNNLNQTLSLITQNNEAGFAWQHLRLAGLVSGNMATAATSRISEVTPFGSPYGFAGQVAVVGFPAGTNVFCAALPPKAAEALDRQLDDGNPQTGNIRAGVEGTSLTQVVTGGSTADAVYVDRPSTYYPVCRKI